MIESITKCEKISQIIYNIAVPASLIVGGIWTLILFYKRKEKVSLHIEIKRKKLIHIKEINKYIIQTDVLIKNTGSRDLDLDYTTACITAYRYDFHNSQIGEILDSKKGLTSKDPHYLGRLRSDVQITLPYLLSVDKPGIHFIEFKISVDMKRYFMGLFGQEKKDWSDRCFLITEEADFEKY